MAEKIEQVFGFDITQAMSALDQLNNGFQQFSKTLEQTGQSIKTFNGSSSRTEAAAKNIGSAFESSFNRATQATERLTVSMGLLSRIVTTQFIVRALSQFRSTVQDNLQDAITFQKSLAEIQTIEPGSGLATLSAQVRELSDAYNIGLSDVSAAKYEAISNGFTTAAQQADVLSASFKFSKVAQTDAGKSLELISGILNAYGLDAANAEAISAKLFKTIELGKVSGTELANSLGRVNSIAAQTGVSLDEILTSFAGLTISGVNASEAATQISATLSAMVKPSEAAEEAFKKLGFSSFETAQATLGLQGTIQGLISTTDGSANAIAKLFPNIRALRSVLSVSPNDARMLDFLKQIQDIDTSQFNKIVDRSIATDAEVVTAELTKLKNFLTVDLGQSALSAAADLSRLTGGVDNVTYAAKTLAPVLLVGTAALSAYAVAAYKGATANAAFMSSFKGGASGFLLAAEAFAGGKLIGNALMDAVEAPGKEFAKAQLKIIEDYRRSEAERLALMGTSDDKRLDATLKAVQNLNQAYMEDVANADAANKLLVKNAQRTTDDIIASREKLAASFKQSAADARNLSQDSQGRVADLEQRKDNRQFDQRTSGLGDAQKAFALTSRASSLANEAAGVLNRAAATGDKVGIARATSLFQEAQKAGETAQAIGARAGNRAIESKAASALEQITNRQIAAEKELQNLQRRRESGLNELAKRQQSVLDSVREQAEIVRRNSVFTDDSGNLLPDDEIAKRKAAAAAASAKIRNSGLSGQDLKQADRLGVGRQAREFNVKLAQQSVDLNFNTTGAIERIQADLRKSFANFKLKLGFDLSGLETSLGRQFKNPEDVARGLEDAKKQVAEYRAELSQASGDTKNAQRIKTELAGISAAFDSADRTALRFLGLNTTPVSALQQRVSGLRQELDYLARSGSLSDKQISDFAAKVEAFGKSDALFSNGVAKNAGLAADFNELARGIGLLKEYQGVQQSLANNKSLDLAGAQQLQALESFIKRFAPPDFSAAANQSAALATNFSSAMSALSTGVGMSAAIAANLTRAAQGAAAIKIDPSAAESSAKRAAGGMVYRAQGGAVGTDTVPAMLTQGEYVVNAANSRKFFSQLQAINAGVAPVSRPGGDSFTTNIGDITVNGGGNGRQVAKDIIHSINRETRRGTGRLRGR